ncbi:glycosyltransferase [Candidatus Dependentiae bacterium]|nr:glycosyltransferase [Candidatus Dependentiae bacterium]
MNKVLFTSHLLEHPPAGGPFLRIENSIKALDKISELHVISRVTKRLLGGEEAEQFFRKLVHAFVYAPSVREYCLLDKIFIKLKNIFIKMTDIDKDASFIVNYAHKNDIDIIWFGFGNISFKLIKRIRKLDSNLKLVCDTDSVWSRYILRELPYEYDPICRKKIELDGKNKELEEREWVDVCDVTTAVSEFDAKYYRSISSDLKKIKIFSNVIDLENYKVGDCSFDLRKPYIYLAGSFASKSPMDKASRWFIKKVFPLVKKKIPNIYLYIVGNDSDKVLSDINDSNIKILGKVVSVLPYLTGADVSIVPLMFESGTRFKILEAAACNVPIVSTTLGAEGLNVCNGKDIFIADDPESFAQCILNVIQNKDLAFNIACNCRRKIEQDYSLSTLIAEGEEILKYLNS